MYPLGVIIQILATLVIVFLALPLHELAHGWVAYKLGDPTAKYEGRLTLNPLASIDPMGAMFLLLFGIGWAKPVPIDSRYFKKSALRRGTHVPCGPGGEPACILCRLRYLLCYCGFCAVQRVCALHFTVLQLFSFILTRCWRSSILLPLPPLDGSKILAALLSDRARYKFYQYQNMLSMVGMLLIVSGALTGPLNVLENAVYGGVSWLAALPFRLAGVL